MVGKCGYSLRRQLRAMRSAALIQRSSHVVELVAPYDSVFWEEAPEVGAWFRSSTGSWWTKADQVDALLSLASYYYEVTDARNHVVQQHKPIDCKRNHFPAHCQMKHVGEPWATLCLIPGAPKALVDAAYRVLAKDAHPDTGGSDKRMKALNSAYEKLKGAL